MGDTEYTVKRSRKYLHRNDYTCGPTIFHDEDELLTSTGTVLKYFSANENLLRRSMKAWQTLIPSEETKAPFTVTVYYRQSESHELEDVYDIFKARESLRGIKSLKSTPAEVYFSNAVKAGIAKRIGLNEPSNRLAHIENEINHSSYILDLKVDWDAENGLAISKEIYLAAIQFLKTYTNYVLTEFSIAIDAPEINPCRDGSVDLSWRTNRARMLVNIKMDKGIPHAFFYGDYYQNTKPFKGNLPANEFEEALAVWMKNLILL